MQSWLLFSSQRRKVQKAARSRAGTLAPSRADVVAAASRCGRGPGQRSPSGHLPEALPGNRLLSLKLGSGSEFPDGNGAFRWDVGIPRGAARAEQSSRSGSRFAPVLGALLGCCAASPDLATPSEELVKEHGFCTWSLSNSIVQPVF